MSQASELSADAPQGWVIFIVVGLLAGLASAPVVYLLNDYVVWPRVIGRAIGIHPAISVVALIAGTELFGITGALFASPVAGLLQAIVIALWRGAVMPAAGRPTGVADPGGGSTWRP